MSKKNEKAAKTMAVKTPAKAAQAPARKAYNPLDSVIRDVTVPGIGGGAPIPIKVKIYKIKPATIEALVTGGVELTAAELLGPEAADKKVLKAWLKAKRALRVKKVRTGGTSPAFLQKRFAAIIKKLEKLATAVLPADAKTAVDDALTILEAGKESCQ